jgi:hypothetical protein
LARPGFGADFKVTKETTPHGAFLQPPPFVVWPVLHRRHTFIVVAFTQGTSEQVCAAQSLFPFVCADLPGKRLLGFAAPNNQAATRRKKCTTRLATLIFQDLMEVPRLPFACLQQRRKLFSGGIIDDFVDD